MSSLAPERKLRGQPHTVLQRGWSPSSWSAWSPQGGSDDLLYLHWKLKNCSYTKKKTLYRKFETNIPRNETVRPFLLQQNRWTDHEYKIANRSMNVGVRNEAAQFHIWEYINRILFEVYSTLALLSVRWRPSYYAVQCPAQSTKELPWLPVVLQVVKSFTVLSALSHRGVGRVYLSTQRINTCDFMFDRWWSPS